MRSIPSVRDLSPIMKVLSDPTRLTIFDLLMQGVQCNCELGARLKLPMNLISHHLKVLRDAGLVNARRDANDARWIYYSVDEPAVLQLRRHLDAFLDVARIQPRQPACGPRVVSEKTIVPRR